MKMIWKADLMKNQKKQDALKDLERDLSTFSKIYSLEETRKEAIGAKAAVPQNWRTVNILEKIYETFEQSTSHSLKASLFPEDTHSAENE
jgi:hypothetical protein